MASATSVKGGCSGEWWDEAKKGPSGPEDWETGGQEGPDAKGGEVRPVRPRRSGACSGSSLEDLEAGNLLPLLPGAAW